MKSAKGEVETYLNLPWENEYQIVRIPEDEGGGFCVCIPLLGANRCRGDGETIAEAVENLRGVLEDLIEEYIRKGRKIPKPRYEDEYSGSIIVRTTSDLHARLIRRAEKEGVSLNHLCSLYLERQLTEANCGMMTEEADSRAGETAGATVGEVTAESHVQYGLLRKKTRRNTKKK